MPRDTLTRDQIVKVAIELLDEEGLDGLNMRALGTRLGSAATAVYWHVGNKANLISLAGDQVWSEIALPDVDSTGWREAITQMATELHATLIRHTWLVQAFGSYPIVGPGRARHNDHGLAVLEAAGFAGEQAAQAATTIFTFVLGNALDPAAMDSLTRKLNREGGNAEEVIRDTMSRATEIASQFPRLRALAGTRSAQYAAAPANSFEFGLRAILDGLEARLL